MIPTAAARVATGPKAVPFLIVNADDFGQSDGINAGVIKAHEEGIVTSASLMVRWPSARAAADYARAHPRMSLGLHFDLGEWAFQDGRWTPLYRVVADDDHAAVEAEFERQLGSFRELVGRSPTHLDSHQHVHRSEPVRTVMTRAAKELGVPLRDSTPGVRYWGDFYGQTGRGAPLPEAITVDALMAIVSRVPPGIVELGCHPGLDGDLRSMYREEREAEVAALCDPRVAAALAASGVRLCSFADLPGILDGLRSV